MASRMEAHLSEGESIGRPECYLVGLYYCSASTAAPSFAGPWARPVCEDACLVDWWRDKRRRVAPDGDPFTHTRETIVRQVHDALYHHQRPHRNAFDAANFGTPRERKFGLAPAACKNSQLPGQPLIGRSELGWPILQAQEPNLVYLYVLRVMQSYIAKWSGACNSTRDRAWEATDCWKFPMARNMGWDSPLPRWGVALNLRTASYSIDKAVCFGVATTAVAAACVVVVQGGACGGVWAAR
uniref:Uncharacterized protein n=1 Tax=Coccidioides posadasii RMSCC 3488 TaxID=454284 RepID=A0A0J6FKX7_COCPO|nr:hypothetical protein CPAG_06402 [Coccidioides posadasii RMSCC 3488]